MSKRKVATSVLAAALVLPFLISNAWATTHESMTQMPMAKEKVYKAGSKENFSSERGFGSNSSMVEAMNLMMVESVAHGQMNMAMAHAAQMPSPGSGRYKLKATISPNPPIVGNHKFAFQILDSKSGKPIGKLNLKAQVFMAEMNMGVTKPKVQEVTPGHYVTSPTFAMAGTWELKLFNAKGFEKTIQFRAGSKKKWMCPEN